MYISVKLCKLCIVYAVCVLFQFYTVWANDQYPKRAGNRGIWRALLEDDMVCVRELCDSVTIPWFI